MSSRCDMEWFNIFKYQSTGPITHSSKVYFERIWGCKNKKMTAKNEPWLEMVDGYNGSCERWKVRLVRAWTP